MITAAPTSNPPSPSPEGARSHRIDALDLVRGGVIVLMALDHVRAFISDAHFDPTDLAHTNVGLFFTRWVTHFVAPSFVFLAGASIYLSRGRKSVGALSRLLATRGLWLIVLELTFVTFVWEFAWSPSALIGQVIWAIGWGMLAMSLLVRLSTRWIVSIGIGIILLHNVSDVLELEPERFGAFAPLWIMLEWGGYAQLPGGLGVFAAYAILPWTGVMAAGYGFGALLKLDAARRARILTRLGLGMIAAFLVLRATGVYGDYVFFSPQSTPDLSMLSFLNASKYPPSLHFLLMTLGPLMLAFPWIERIGTRPARGAVVDSLVTAGRVPFLFYVLHLPFIHLIAIGLGMAAGFSPGDVGGALARSPGHGWGLPLVYLVTVGVLLVLYPALAWFARLKRRRKDWWLSYL